MSERTTSSNWARGIVQALELGGVDCRPLFQQLQLDYPLLNDPDARFPQDSMTRLWHLAVQASGNPAIGLNMARLVRPSSFSVVGYALMSSRTLKEGFSRLVRYQRLIGESADMTLRAVPQGYGLSLAIHGDRLPPARQSMEASIAYLLAFCRWMTGFELQPEEVCFQGPPPADLAPYRDVFKAPLRFNAERYELIFSRAELERELPTANEALAQLHDRFAAECLARFADSRVSHMARQVLFRLLPLGEPKREAVAQALNVSQRTLQRRLQDEGNSFQQLLDETRRTLALQYLGQPERSLLEIAYLLGFADPSNFFRAFRRWHACTPGEYRAQL